MGILDSVTKVFTSNTRTQSAIRPSKDDVLKALSVVIDPDLQRDIVSLGFVKSVEIQDGSVSCTVELTTPACPVKELLRTQCIEAISALDGVSSVQVQMTARAPQSVTQNGKPVEPALARVANIIAIASGKGGVGKSTTTVNLAYALAKAGAKVGIVDADVYGPSLLQMTKVDMPTAMNGDLVIPPVRDGVKIISSAMFTHGAKAAALRGPMVSQLIRQFLTKVDWGELDYLLIDYPPGTGDVQITLSQMVPITGAVIITTPQEVSLIDVRRAVSMFDTVKIPVIGVVENMSYFVCNGCSEKHELFPGSGGKRLSGEIGMPLLATFPMDPRIARKSDEGEPFSLGAEKSVAHEEYTNLAANVAREVSMLNHQGSKHLESFKIIWRKS